MTDQTEAPVVTEAETAATLHGRLDRQLQRNRALVFDPASELGQMRDALAASNYVIRSARDALAGDAVREAEIAVLKAAEVWAYSEPYYPDDGLMAAVSALRKARSGPSHDR